MNLHATDVKQGNRFAFGKNWRRFLNTLDDSKIQEAENSLKMMLRVSNLIGKTFLDIGSGSGLFSLAAHRLGAVVTSFDFDPDSFACTDFLRQKYGAESEWIVRQGSVLDEDFVCVLGEYDIVYSWGVLHHTGSMHKAITMASSCVSKRGKFFIALYNDQGWLSKYWLGVKYLYNKGGVWGRFFSICIPLPYFFLHRLFKMIIGKQIPRAMSFWTDVIDWVGGYPFEVVSPESITDTFYDLGFVLEKQKTVKNKLGCNEFVFAKIST